MAFTSMKGGVLVVDKPAGPTSFAVVERVRRAMGAGKAGHTGTLDPAATGVLAVCLDDGVKLQHWITGADKAYEAVVVLGFSTDTEDAEGTETGRGDASGLDAAAVAAALRPLVGEIDQVPPMYSAIRVGGRRLHEAARAGEEVDRQPRRVVVHALDLVAFEPAAGGVARARIAVRCGKGTYVRSLASALGRSLGVPAHLGQLRRTAAGPFRNEDALPVDAVERMAREAPAALAARVVRPAAALGELPAVPVSPPEVLALVQGRSLHRDAPGPLCRALDERGELVAVCAPADGGGGLKPVRVFVQPLEIRGSGPSKR
jgi:tRNA pseudouridine55 synthase